MSTDDSYAPKSPDFSSFFSSAQNDHQVPPLDLGTTIQHQPSLQSPPFVYGPSYIPPTQYGQGYNIAANPLQPPVLPHQQHSFPSTLACHQRQPQAYYPQQYYQQQHHNQHQPQEWRSQHVETYPSQLAASSTPFVTPYRQQELRQNHQSAPPQPPQQQHQNQNQNQHQPPPPPPVQSQPKTTKMPPRKARIDPLPPAAPIIDSSMVKTKFPTARIKRIMQADEEVGKVAQQTPIAVGKALELFMIQLVSRSAEVAKDRGSKRVTASMLKQVVESDEQWDFLRDIVSRVETEKEGTTKAKLKAEAETDSDEDNKEPVVRNKRGAGRRKKRSC